MATATAEERGTAQAAFEQGESCKAIGARLGRHPDTIKKWSSRYGWERPDDFLSDRTHVKRRMENARAAGKAAWVTRLADEAVEAADLATKARMIATRLADIALDANDATLSAKWNSNQFRSAVLTWAIAVDKAQQFSDRLENSTGGADPESLDPSDIEARAFALLETIFD